MLRILPLVLSVLLSLTLALAQDSRTPTTATTAQESKEQSADQQDQETTNGTTDEEATDEEATDASATRDAVEDAAEDEASAPLASSILEVVAADARFSMLYEALDAAGLLNALAEEGPFTLFAPTDEAFMALSESELEELVNDQDALLRVLRYHVAEGLFADAELLEVSEMTTLEGAPVFITVAEQEAGGAVMVNEARLLDSVAAENGVVYAIDAVLLPPAPNGDSVASR